MTDGAPADRRVRVLPDDLANQIAAGEVVERPASVVKELIENALDAGARRVAIEIEAGGLGLVRVADDGSGMSADDARLSLLRHATSKLATIDDLRAIRSYGFRGEALPSIASVSRFTLRTRRASDDEGTFVSVEGGAPASVRPCGCAPGTIVEVRDLFFNVPARRKFLRGASTESAHVTEVATAAALGNPGVTVSLARDGRKVKEWLRATSREERVRGAFAGEPLAACRGERGPLAVEAFVSRPERARMGATALLVFVNGRPVRDRALARAVAQAYGSVLEPGRYPVGAVYLDLPYELVDVNAHPQKAEVRFADGRAVADALYRIVAAELGGAFGIAAPAPGWSKRPSLLDAAPPAALTAWAWSSGAPGTDESRAEARADRDGAAAPAWGSRTDGAEPERAAEPVAADPWGLAGDAEPPARHGGSPSRPTAAGAGAARASTADGDAARAGAGDVDGGATSNAAAPIREEGIASAASALAGTSAAGPRPAMVQSLRFVAQVRLTYLVCEGPDGLYLLDQHAAAERVTFHRLRRGYESRGVAMQKLLFPVLVDASASEIAVVEEAHDAIARAGLDVTAAGPGTLAVQAVPQLLARAAPERLVRDLLTELARTGERAFSGAIDRALATMACHGSLRAGDPVAAEEAAALLAALDGVDFGGHCPHGRPIVMRIGWNELDHRVGRR